MPRGGCGHCHHTIANRKGKRGQITIQGRDQAGSSNRDCQSYWRALNPQIKLSITSQRCIFLTILILLMSPHANPTPGFSQLVAAYSKVLRQRDETQQEPCIEVDLTGKHISSLYEQIRQVVDYKEEHLILRSVIERIVKRRLRSQRPTGIGEGLIKELILASYIQNGTIPVRAVEEIDRIIEKYVYLRSNFNALRLANHLVVDEQFIFPIMAAEIEQRLVSHNAEQELVRFAVQSIKLHSDISEKSVYASPEAEDLALTIIAYRQILKSDTPAIFLMLLRVYLPEWDEWSIKEAKEKRDILSQVFRDISDWMTDPLSAKFTRYVAHYKVSFDVLDLVLKRSEELALKELEYKPNLLQERVRGQYHQLKALTNRAFLTSLARAVLYILLTKVLIGLVVEVPLELYFFSHVGALPLLINTMTPPLLLCLWIWSAPLPDSNLRYILADVDQFAFGVDPGEERRVARLKHAGDPELRSIFTYILSVLYVLVLVVVGILLGKLGFTVISGFFFYLFVSITLYFGTRISVKRLELVRHRRRPTVLQSFLNILSMPFLRIGKRLSRSFAQYNILTFALDLLMEAPVKSFVEIFASWKRFLDEYNSEV